MQPETEGKEEKGPNHIPYINDPGKRPHPDSGAGEPEDSYESEFETTDDAEEAGRES
ncbi:hypothetical protein [Pseudomonas sp. v388]|uniref:hypothetical protein n=1 Tax=Pseudomonas sp. v388 TaxID=2479849 RepID=UPI0015AB7CDD|nr:hypothetical protein [Pseudomonas sp. v388]